MAFRVSFDFDGLPEALKPGQFADVVREEATRAVNEGTVILKNGLVSASPFGGTNALRTGWQIAPAVARPGLVRGTVANATVQANIIEKGARGHFPPVGPTGEPALGVWIRRVLGITEEKKVRQAAFLIGRAIKKRGLPRAGGLPKGWFSRVVRGLEPRVAARMDAMARRITERLAA